MLNLDGVSLTEIRKKLKDLELATTHGYNIPELLVTALKHEIRVREGIVEVWECIQCQSEFQLMVVPTEMSCRCGKIHRTWKA